MLERHPAGRIALARLGEGRTMDAHYMVNVMWLLEPWFPDDVLDLLDKLREADD